MNEALNIFDFLADSIWRCERAVLVTMIHLEGSSVREVGSQMVVTASGTTMGSFSGGCIEEAIVAEALAVLEEGLIRRVRFGAGSHYIDIRLPCGGGIDLLFFPDPDLDTIYRASSILSERQSLSVEIAPTGMTATVAKNDAMIRDGWNGWSFRARYDPRLRLVVVGHGAEPVPLLRLARCYGAETTLASPDRRLVDLEVAAGHDATYLPIAGQAADVVVDQWTAVVLLFHDHDWEPVLLSQFLDLDPFFIGALGSRQTHAERCRRLIESGCEPERVEKIVGPIGLIPATRDPETLAVSVLSQVVGAFKARRANLIVLPT